MHARTSTRGYLDSQKSCFSRLGALRSRAAHGGTGIRLPHLKQQPGLRPLDSPDLVAREDCFWPIDDLPRCRAADPTQVVHTENQSTNDSGRMLTGIRADVRHIAGAAILVCNDTLGRHSMTDKKLDPTGERAEATEAMKSTPISGKEHEYRADGDHHPRQDAATVEGGTTDAVGRAAAGQEAAPEVGVETERHISEGIPGAGRSPETSTVPSAQRERGTRA